METGAAGMSKICYTARDAQAFPLGQCADRLQSHFQQPTSAEWKWHTTCPKSGYEADGEAIFRDPENYTVKSTSVSKAGDKVRNSRTTITAKWLGSDCGSVQPLGIQP